MFESWKNNNQRKNTEARAELNVALSKLREEEDKLAIAQQSYQKSFEKLAAFDPKWERHLMSTYELPLMKLTQDRELAQKELISVEALLAAVTRLAELQPSTAPNVIIYQAQKRDLQNKLASLEREIPALQTAWDAAKTKHQ